MSSIYPHRFLSLQDYEDGKSRIILPSELDEGLFDLTLRLKPENCVRYGSYATKFLVEVGKIKTKGNLSAIRWDFVPEGSKRPEEQRTLSINPEGILFGIKIARKLNLQKTYAATHEMGYLSEMSVDIDSLLNEDTATNQLPLDFATLV